MRTYILCLSLLNAAFTALYSQDANVQLHINPISAWRSTTPVTVVFTAEVSSSQLPVSATLCLTDPAGSVISTHGELRDDGIVPDVTANDHTYTLNIQLPADKLGTLPFLVRMHFSAPEGEADSQVRAFVIDAHLPENAEGDLWVHSFQDKNIISYFINQPNVKRVKIFRSNELNGNWTAISDTTFENAEAGKADEVDSDSTAPSLDRYYKVELYDSGAVLKKTYSPVFVPAYGPDRILLLTGNPPQSQIAHTSTQAQKKTKD